MAGTNNEAERTLRNPASARNAGRANKTPVGARRQTIIVSVLESMRVYLKTFTLANVHDRHILDRGQLVQVVTAAATNGVVFRGIPGEERAMIYAVACASGFRAGEIASLCPKDFDLSGQSPELTLSGTYTKNHKTAVQPLPAELTPILRDYLDGKASGSPIWPGTWCERAADMLRIELDVCGILYIVHVPDSPLFADLHCLRHSVVALLDKSGATLKEAMQLARHSDPKPTKAVYRRARLQDLAGAVDRMPAILATPERHDGRNPLAATGTEAVYRENRSDFLAISCAPHERRIANMTTHDTNEQSGTLKESTMQPDGVNVQAAADKLGRLLFSTHIRLCVTGRPDDEDVAEQKLREMAGAFGQFAAPRLASFHPVKKRRWQRHSTFLLSTEELATLWHLPTLTVRAPTMTAVESREMEPPVRLPTKQEHPGMAILGQTEFRGSRQRFGILPEDRRRHLAIVGKTGMGKTTLLHQLILSDIRAGRGVALLDPHGDLCDSLLASIPRERTNDVILFDAADTMHPLSFNLLHCPRPEQRPLVASGIVSSFKKLYGEFWGPRMEHILRNAVLALLEVPGSTLLSILRILTDTKFRQPLVAKLKDPVVRAFWESEFASLPKKFQLEAVAPIQNKIGHFVSSPLLRNILGQSRSNLDLRSAMDDGKILLVNLSKGRLGDDVSALLGSFLVTALQLAAMSRADIPESERRDFFLYIDEFQNFATDSFATILSEARKYRLALILANQYLGQLDEETLLAVWGNCGSLISFQVGASDAEPLALQFGGDLTPQDLMRLPRYQAYVRLLVEGMPSRPFSMRTLAPGAPADRERPGIIRRTSRQRYARPLAQVEREIAAALAR